jgi:tryptophan synthase beta chain
LPTHSISAGLDYPGVGPEHSQLKESGRVTYTAVDDKAALAAFAALTKLEGIIPALESAHALAYLEKLAPRLNENDVVVVCLSGRGDKDMDIIKEEKG